MHISYGPIDFREEYTHKLQGAAINSHMDGSRDSAVGLQFTGAVRFNRLLFLGNR